MRGNAKLLEEGNAVSKEQEILQYLVGVFHGRIVNLNIPHLHRHKISKPLPGDDVDRLA